MVDVVTKLWNSLYLGIDGVIRSFRSQGVPTTPAMLATAVDFQSINLTITTPSTIAGNSPVHGYKFYQLINGTWTAVSSEVVDITSSAGEFLVSSLAASAQYSFRCEAISVEGVASTASSTVSATTNSLPSGNTEPRWVDTLPDVYNLAVGEAFDKTFTANDPDIGDLIDISVAAQAAGVNTQIADQVGNNRSIRVWSSGLTESASVAIDLSAANLAQQEWDTRSTAPGVIQAIEFSDVNTYNAGVVPDQFAGDVSRPLTGGVTGGPHLRIDYPAVSGYLGSVGSWKCYLDRQWDKTRINSEAYVKSVGLYDVLPSNDRVIYVQVRFKIPQTWIPPGEAGHKVVIVSTAYHSSVNGEHTIARTVESAYPNVVPMAYRRYIGAGNEINAGFETQVWDAPYYGSGYDKQNAHVENSVRQCVWAGATPPEAWANNCYFYTPEKWMCIYLRIRYGDTDSITTNGSWYGTAGNQWDWWMWTPGETGYTHIQSYRDYALSDVARNGYMHGPNGMHFTPLDYGTQTHAEATYALYDQIIVSTQPIACPTV